MLTVSNLTKNFGTIRAVKGVTFTVEKGEVLGLSRAERRGKIDDDAHDHGLYPAYVRDRLYLRTRHHFDPVAAKRCIGYLPENAPSYHTMTVTDFLTFIGRIRGYKGSALTAKVEAAIEKSRLDSVRKQTIETLSKGYRQRTCFAQAILHDPQVLIMDEPTDGLDPNQKYVVRQMIKEMAADKAIIVSTHILEEVDAVCTRAIVIAGGSIVANGTPAELRAQDPQGRLDVVFRNLTMTEAEKHV